MSWARTVRDWNRSGQKVIVDAGDVYALPLRGTPEYKVVKDLYEHKREKGKKADIEAEAKILSKSKEEEAKKKEKEIERVIAERKREEAERAMMGGEEILTRAYNIAKKRQDDIKEAERKKHEEKLAKERERYGTRITNEEANKLYDEKYVPGYEFGNRKDMEYAVKVFAQVFPFMSHRDIGKTMINRGLKGKEFDIAFNREAKQPGFSFVQQTLSKK